MNDMTNTPEQTDEIAELNKQVQATEVGGGFANDERDRRDLLIKKLGEQLEIRWTEGAASDQLRI